MVKIITDSICDLDPGYLAPYDVEIMPLRVRLGTRSIWTRSRSTIWMSAGRC